MSGRTFDGRTKDASPIVTYTQMSTDCFIQKNVIIRKENQPSTVASKIILQMRGWTLWMVGLL